MPVGEHWKTPTGMAVGDFATVFTTNEVPVDMHQKTFNAFPALTPLTSMLIRLSEDNATQVQVDWIEENDIPVSLVQSSAIASGAGTLVVNHNAKTAVLGTLLFNPDTFEIVKVSDDPAPTSDTDITITRGAAGTTAAAASAGTVWRVLPPDVPEDDNGKYRSSSVANDRFYNYVQLVRMNYTITRIADKSTTHFGGPGSKRAQLKRQKYKEFRKKWEQLLYFGGRSSGGTAPANVRTMGGLVHYLKDGTLYKDFNHAFTESGFDQFLGDYHDENPDAMNIWFMCANNVKRQIGYWLKDKVRPNTFETKRFGIDVQEYFLGPLNVNIVELPLLVDSVTKGWGFLLDFDRMTMKTLDRATFVGDALGVGQSEKIHDLYRVATSFLIGNESRHAMCINATA